MTTIWQPDMGMTELTLANEEQLRGMVEALAHPVVYAVLSERERSFVRDMRRMPIWYSPKQGDYIRDIHDRVIKG